MAGFLTEQASHRLLDCLFGGRAIEPPPALYFGLSLARAFRGGHVVEPSGCSYARVEVANDLAHFPGTASGRKSNAGAIVFPAPTGRWGTIRSVFVADSSEGGRVLAMADLPRPLEIDRPGTPPTIAPEALSLTLL